MATVLSLMMLTMLALLAGALFLWRRRGPRKQIVLMLVLAAVIAVNVALLAVPGADGDTPVDRLSAQEAAGAE